jgi:hypothetical protein
MFPPPGLINQGPDIATEYLARHEVSVCGGGPGDAGQPDE